MLGYLEQNLSWQPVYAEQMDLALLVLRELLSTEDFARCGTVAAKFRGNLTRRPELHAIAVIARVLSETTRLKGRGDTARSAWQIACFLCNCNMQ